PLNVVRNQNFTFCPLVFYEQFKFFFNLYFLLIALSQLVPALKIGFIMTYIAPLVFVLTVTMGKEAYDDYNWQPARALAVSLPRARCCAQQARYLP
ncbi:hypothetical protein C8Q76DRAFT_824950, partial [Earliella scabrosa]